MPTIAIGSSGAAGRRGRGGGRAGPRRRRGCGRRCSASAARGRVVEDQGGRQPQAGGGGQPVAQLDRGQRVEAEVLERPRRVDRVRASRGRARRRHALRTSPQQALAVARSAGSAARRRGQRGAGAGAGGAARPRGPGRAAAAAACRRGPGARSAVGSRRDRRAARRRRLAERRRRTARRPCCGGQRRQRRCGPAGRGRRRRGAPVMPLRCLPQAPGRARCAGRPCARGAGGEGVEEGVGGGVVGLAGRCRASPATEENSTNGRQVQVAAVSSCRCQAASSLRAQHARRAARRSARSITPSSSTPAACTTPVSGCSAGIAPSRCGKRGRGRRRRRRRPSRSAPERGQLGDQLGGARGVRAAAADQQQVPDAVRGDQVPGEQRAEPAGAAGDQHGAVRVEAGAAAVPAGCARPGRGGQIRRSRARASLRLARRELRLAGSDAPRRAPAAGSAAVEVEQHEPARVLGLRRADQAPDRRARPGRAPPRRATRRRRGDARPGASRLSRSSASQACSRVERTVGGRVDGAGGRRRARSAADRVRDAVPSRAGPASR